jgi:predicted RNA-binding protein with PIN domain
VSPSAANPLDGVDRLIVDGTNLLHALGRLPDGERLPQAALIGRLRAAVPAAVAIEIVFDGAPEPGLRGTRIAAGVLVRYGGRWSADRAIVGLVDEARTVAGSARGADNVLVVTDDRELRLAVRDRGAGTARAAWLLARLGRTRPSAPTTGAGRAPAGGARPVVGRPEIGRPNPAEPDDDRPGWRPGRGATAKKGNPRRTRRSSRPPGGSAR